MPQGRPRRPSATPRNTEGRQSGDRTSSQSNDGIEAIVHRILEYAARHYTERQARSNSERSRDNPDHGQQPRGGHVDASDITRLILGQLVQYIVHRYLTNRARSQASQQRRARSNRQGEQQRSRETDAVRTHPSLPNRHIDELLVSIDNLLQQLQSTEALVQRTMYRPATHPGCAFHRSVITNAESLQVSISRASAGARRVSQFLEQERRLGARNLGGRTRERRRDVPEERYYVRRHGLG